LPQHSDSSRLVVEVSRRGRLVTGDPYFTPGVPLQLDVKGHGEVASGDLAIVRTGRGRARVEEVIGPADHVENVLEALLVERGARAPFERQQLPEIDVASRVDLRELLTYTVDPDTAKDFDDALSFRREPGGIRAWVHIADVSYFVGAGTPLDDGAARRALSTYVPGKVAPMLPYTLADDACSLRPHQDRLCVTVELPPEGGEPEFYRSVIRSDARLTYGEAERREAPPAILESLALNDELASSLRAKRFARGALQVQTPEVAFRFDGRGGVADAWLEGEPHAHMFVEELMILANEHVGAFLASRRREALYRVHERPDPQAVELLIAKLTDLGVPTPPVPDHLSPQQAAAVAGEASNSTSRRRAAGARRSRRSSCARSSRRATIRRISATPVSRAPRTATSPRRSAATRTSSSTARSCASSGSRTTPRRTTSTHSPNTCPSASGRRRSSSTSPTTSASPGCSSGASSSSGGTHASRVR
jgi:ribonuclease R